MNFNRELEAAVSAAKAAGAIQQNGRTRLLEIVRKDDESPVTQIDRECEAVILDTLRKAFPSDSFLGEENGSLEGSSGRRWIIDPLDGTRPYIRGIPTYSVLIGLEDETGPLLGVVNLPDMNELYQAARGSGAFRNGEPISVSHVSSLRDAMGTHLGLAECAGKPSGHKLQKLCERLDYNYGFMDAFSYAAVACGRADVSIGLIDKSWDRLAPAAIILEAGGRVSDLAGTPGIHGDGVVFTNGKLHDEVIAVLNG